MSAVMQRQTTVTSRNGPHVPIHLVALPVPVNPRIKVQEHPGHAKVTKGFVKLQDSYLFKPILMCNV